MSESNKHIIETVKLTEQQESLKKEISKLDNQISKFKSTGKTALENSKKNPTLNYILLGVILMLIIANFYVFQSNLVDHKKEF